MARASVRMSTACVEILCWVDNYHQPYNALLSHHINWSSPPIQGLPGILKTWFSRTTIMKKQTHCWYQALLASHRNPPDAQMVFLLPRHRILVLVIANCNCSVSHAEEHVYFYGVWGYRNTANMDSHRSRKSKGFASLPCVYWRWQYWKVLTYRQSNLAASVHEGRWRCNQCSADAFNRGRSDRNYVGHSS